MEALICCQAFLYEVSVCLSHQAYEPVIARGVWTVEFSDWGTRVVPIRKTTQPGWVKAKLQVCGDYSVTVKPQPQVHRQPLPLPEDWMNKLGSDYGFTKIYLADAYNQIKPGPISWKRLSFSTHRRVLLQNVLPFGISSASGYFQSTMEDILRDLHGIAVYLDDILVSGSTAAEHLQNLQMLLDRLTAKGLRCLFEKCQFAQPQVDCLGHILSWEGVAEGPKVDAVRNMPPPTDVPTLRSFLGLVQFYAKFLPPGVTSVSELGYRLTRKEVPWRWGQQEVVAFNSLKKLLSADNVLTHFDASLPIGIACDASDVGIGAVLFHR